MVKTSMIPMGSSPSIRLSIGFMNGGYATLVSPNGRCKMTLSIRILAIQGKRSAGNTNPSCSRNFRLNNHLASASSLVQRPMSRSASVVLMSGWVSTRSSNWFLPSTSFSTEVGSFVAIVMAMSRPFQSRRTRGTAHFPISSARRDYLSRQCDRLQETRSDLHYGWSTVGG